MTAPFWALAGSGCGFHGNREFEKTPNPYFENLYSMYEEAIEEEVEKDEASRITLSTSGMPLLEFLRFVSDNSGISIICDQKLDNQVVNVNVVDTDVRDVLSAVARRHDADITEQGNVFYIGTLKPHDRAILVRKIRRLTSAEILSMVQTLTSEVGKVAAASDGLTVVGDRVRVLQNINAMFDQVERAQTNTWVLQLYLISGTNSLTRELGVDTAATFDVAATIANSRSKIESLGVFNAVLKSARTDSRYRIIAEPMMLLTDGGESSIQDGETIPIPKRTVSDSGTVNTTGYEYVKTGIVVKNKLREMSVRTAICRIEIEMTQVTSYVDAAPVTTGQTFETTAVLESGGTYLVGSMTRKSVNRDDSGAFVRTMSSSKDNAVNVEIWVRCYRIRGEYGAK